MDKNDKYIEEVVLTEKYHRFKVFIDNNIDIITFEKSKSISEVMNLFSKKVIGIIGIK